MDTIICKFCYSNVPSRAIRQHVAIMHKTGMSYNVPPPNFMPMPQRQFQQRQQPKIQSLNTVPYAQSSSVMPGQLVYPQQQLLETDQPVQNLSNRKRKRKLKKKEPSTTVTKMAKLAEAKDPDLNIKKQKNDKGSLFLDSSTSESPIHDVFVKPLKYHTFCNVHSNFSICIANGCTAVNTWFTRTFLDYMNKVSLGQAPFFEDDDGPVYVTDEQESVKNIRIMLDRLSQGSISRMVNESSKNRQTVDLTLSTQQEVQLLHQDLPPVRPTKKTVDQSRQLIMKEDPNVNVGASTSKSKSDEDCEKAIEDIERTRRIAKATAQSELVKMKLRDVHRK